MDIPQVVSSRTNDVEEDRTQALVTLYMNNKQLGIACYEELTNIIYAGTLNMSMEHIEETIITIKRLLKPTIFLLHPKIIANQSLFELILSGLDGTQNYYRYKVIKTATWIDKSCQYLIHNCLQIRRLHKSNTSYQYISSIIDLEYEPTRQCLGALISFMQETIFKLDEGKVIISSIQALPLESFVRIDKISYEALQIFSEEIHPNVIKGKGRSKEGFSLFGLFDRTNSLPGKQKLRDWMSMPYYNKEKIIHRQNGIHLIMKSCNKEFIRSIQSFMKHFHDLPK